jgi:hypothetical protein
MRIASYAKVRIAAPALRKKIRRRTMQLKRRPDFVNARRFFLLVIR